MREERPKERKRKKDTKKNKEFESSRVAPDLGFFVICLDWGGGNNSRG